MVYCMAFGCANDSRKTKSISYHRLPSDPGRRKIWLAKISREAPVISKNSVVCSEHFTPDCFERNIRAEILGGKAITKLKADAVPTIFCHLPPPKKPRLSSVRRQNEAAKKEVRKGSFELWCVGGVAVPFIFVFGSNI